jgi:hypothetical protein
MSPSCIFDPKQEVDPPPVIEVTWPDMTSRDDVLETLVLTYENAKDPDAVPKYRALLHSQYFFGLAPQDVPVGGSPIISRSEDVTVTEKMFEFEKILELSLDPMVATWYEYPELEGEVCENCWATQPSYFIRAQFGDEDKVYISPPDNSEVSIIVAPDENDPTKWVLRAMYDLCVIQ